MQNDNLRHLAPRYPGSAFCRNSSGPASSPLETAGPFSPLAGRRSTHSFVWASALTTSAISVAASSS